MTNETWKGEHFIRHIRYSSMQRTETTNHPERKRKRELPRDQIKPVPGHLNVYDITDRYGFSSYHRVHWLRRDGRFPEPTIRIQSRMWWSIEDLEAWEKKSGIISRG